MIDEKKLELLKKLQALAERGVGGEKEGAQRKLEQLMKKYGIEDLDLTQEDEEDFDFKYKNEYEHKILRQLFYKIVPDYRKRTYYYKYGKGSRSTYGIRCTKAQGLQIQIEYDFFRDLWKEDVDFLLKAFIQKHRLFSTRSKDDIDESPMDRAEKMRMMAMMFGMQEKSIMPMLEEKED